MRIEDIEKRKVEAGTYMVSFAYKQSGIFGREGQGSNLFYCPGEETAKEFLDAIMSELEGYGSVALIAISKIS